jgi:hypothetical protein
MDSCTPLSKLKWQSYRVYSILIPMVLMVFALECIYVFMSVPSSSIGNAMTAMGPYSSAAAMKALTSAAATGAAATGIK